MNAERLLKLADFLDQLPPERFNYQTWTGDNCPPEGPNLECGTTACALGWAAAIPEFRDLGLRLCSIAEDNGQRWPRMAYSDKSYWSAIYEATEAIFDIDSEQTGWLFVPNSFPASLGNRATAKEVAEHILKFVASGGVIPE